MATLHPSNPFYDPWCRSKGIEPQSATVDPAAPKPHPAPPAAPKRSTTAPVSPSHPTQSPNYPYYQLPAAATYRTRSIGGPYSTGVIIEREIDTTSPPNDDEIIIATVRITSSFRRASIQGSEDLPSRPPRRNFLRRVSTRLAGSQDGCKYTALKMPRRDYKKFFARDTEGGYAGTEPEREWTREDLERDFGRFQNMPLRSIPGANEYGEGDKWWVDSNKEDVEQVEKRNDSVLG